MKLPFLPSFLYVWPGHIRRHGLEWSKISLLKASMQLVTWKELATVVVCGAAGSHSFLLTPSLARAFVLPNCGRSLALTVGGVGGI